MEQSLADRGDGGELIDTKISGVHLTGSQLQPSQVCLYVYDMGIGLLIIL